MQGDIHRAKQKEKLKAGHYSSIVTGVDEMRLHDIIADSYSTYKDYHDDDEVRTATWWLLCVYSLRALSHCHLVFTVSLQPEGLVTSP